MDKQDKFIIIIVSIIIFVTGMLLIPFVFKDKGSQCKIVDKYIYVPVDIKEMCDMNKGELSQSEVGGIYSNYRAYFCEVECEKYEFNFDESVFKTLKVETKTLPQFKNLTN